MLPTTELEGHSSPTCAFVLLETEAKTFIKDLYNVDVLWLKR